MYLHRFADFLYDLADREPEIVRRWERSWVHTCPQCGHNIARAEDTALQLRDPQLQLPLPYRSKA